MIKKNEGIVPINAPKIGIKLVVPTRTLIKKAYGILNTNIPKKHKVPIISASVHWPRIKPENTLLVVCPISNILSAISPLRYAYITFFI